MNAFIEFVKQNTGAIVELVLVIALFAEGLYQIISGKMLNYAGFDKRYTKESVDRFVRPSGVTYLLEGVGIFLFAFSIDDGPFPGFVEWIGVAIMLLSIVGYLVMMKVMLVKVKD